MSEENKKLYIVPGFKQSVEDENYKEIVNYAKEVGLEIKPVHVSWNHDIDMNDYIKEVSEQIPKESDDYILGFSFGAYISYLLSKEKRFAGYIFCTISPYFKETIEEIPRRAKEFFGDNFIRSVSDNSLHEGNKSRAWFLVGEKDWDQAKYIGKEAKDLWSGESEFVMVHRAAHEIGHLNYVEEIKWILKNLTRERK